MMPDSGNKCLAVEGRDLSFYYDSRTKQKILDDLSISVPKGVIYGLLGPSGCGKTTLLRSIVGRLKPSEGSIKVFGRVPCEKGFPIPGSGVGYMPQELALFPEITPEETLVFFGKLFQLSREEIRNRIAFLSTLLDIPLKNRLTKNLSGGQKRRLSFAAALIHSPPLLILDEPTVGVDPLLRENIWAHLRKIAIEEQSTIIITTHYVEEARKADLVGLMRDGHLLTETNPEMLISSSGMSTLEEVFLKLCLCQLKRPEIIRKEAHETKDNQEDAPGNDIAETVMTDVNADQCGDEEMNLMEDPMTSRRWTKRQKSSSFGSSLNRISALMLKDYMRLIRNIPLLSFQILLPAIETIMFFVCMGGEPFDLPLAVVNLEDGGFSNEFLGLINNHIIKQNHYSNYSAALKSVYRKENCGIVDIRQNFSKNFINRYALGIYADKKTVQESIIKLHLDMSNKLITNSIISNLITSYKEFARNVLIQEGWNPVHAESPILIEEPVYGNLQDNYSNYIAPGLILGILYFMSVGLTTMSLINDKREGLLDRSWIAGVKTWEMIASIFSLLFFVMLIQLALELVLVLLIFKMSFRGPLIWVILACIINGMGGMAYGLFISAIANSIELAMIIALGSFLPNLFLSALIWPFEAMPHFLRYVGYCLPLTSLTVTVRNIFSRGLTITDEGMWLGFAIPSLWMLTFVILASIILKYTK